MQCGFLCALFLASVPMFGQAVQPTETLSANAMFPDAPSVQIGGADTRVVPNLRSLGERAPSLEILSSPQEKPRRVADRGFWFLTLFQVGAVVADVETTQYALAHGGHEWNPLAGDHPSRTRLYGISLPLSAGLAIWSYELKKLAPHSHYWMIPSVGCGSAHTVAAIRNLVVAKP
jgi:hypothetical protein